MWRLSSSFIAWRKMWASRVRGGQRRSAKWKALLESCRRKIDTGRLYTTQFLSSSSFSSPFSFWSFARLLSLLALPYLFLSLPSPLSSSLTVFHESPVDHSSDIDLLRASLFVPLFFLRISLAQVARNIALSNKLKLSTKFQNNFLSFRKFSRSNFINRILSIWS